METGNWKLCSLIHTYPVRRICFTRCRRECTVQYGVHLNGVHVDWAPSTAIYNHVAGNQFVEKEKKDNYFTILPAA